MKYLTVLSLASLVLVSCSTPPVVPTYAEYEKRYPKSDEFERVIFDFKAVCNDEGICRVNESTLDAAELVITELNNTVDDFVLEINEKVGALIECKLTTDELKVALFYKDQQAQRQGWIGGAKTLVAAGLGVLACR